MPKSEATTKKYQYLKDINKCDEAPEYIRIRILFNDVGIGGDEFWGGESSGYSMTASEIEDFKF